MVNSGSSANYLAIEWAKRHAQEHGLVRNEVITPALTWATTVAPILQHGLKPVFVDVGPDLVLDPAKVRDAITERTLSVFPVHLLGNPADMHAFYSLRRDDVTLLEDCCEALGSKLDGRNVGTWGDAATWSFYFSHNLSSVEGGMLAYPEEDRWPLAWREHGWTRSYAKADKEAINKQHPNLDPRWVFDELGYNFRSTEFNAALALVQWERQGEFNNRRLEIAQAYHDRLRHSTLTHVNFKTGAIPFSYPLLVNGGKDYARVELVAALEQAGIETRPILTGDIRQHPWYQRNNHAWRSVGESSWTTRAHQQGILLPVHPRLSNYDVDYVIHTVNSFLKTETGEGLT